jgi:hypothetical protein
VEEGRARAEERIRDDDRRLGRIESLFAACAAMGVALTAREHLSILKCRDQAALDGWIAAAVARRGEADDSTATPTSSP